VIRTLLRARPPTTHQLAGVPSYLPWPGAPVLPEEYPGLGYCSESEALDLPAVAASLDLLVSLVQQMPLTAFVGGNDDLSRGDDLIVPTPPILSNPAPGPGRTLSDWIAETIRDLALHGNAVAVLGDPGPEGWPTEMFPVPYEQWTLRPDGAYLVGSDVYEPADVFHVRRGCRTGEPVGRGLMETHPRLLAAAIAAEKFAADYFTGGAAPPTFLTHPDPELSQTMATILKAKFQAVSRRREPIVAPAGTTIQALTADADGAQMSETRKWNAQQIALAMGVVPALLGLDSPSLTYKNLSDVYRQFISSTVLSYLVPIEDQITAQCLPYGQRARFDPRSLLRPDTEGRVDIAVKGYQAGVMTRDEARSVVDLPPEADSDDAAMSVRDLAEAIQKIYLGVGKVISVDEARDILNREGAGLTGTGPASDEADASLSLVQPTEVGA
jgi:HK97 family phage portal protein